MGTTARLHTVIAYLTDHKATLDALAFWVNVAGLILAFVGSIIIALALFVSRGAAEAASTPQEPNGLVPRPGEYVRNTALYAFLMNGRRLMLWGALPLTIGLLLQLLAQLLPFFLSQGIKP